MLLSSCVARPKVSQVMLPKVLESSFRKPRALGAVVPEFQLCGAIDSGCHYDGHLHHPSSMCWSAFWPFPEPLEPRLCLRPTLGKQLLRSTDIGQGQTLLLWFSLEISRRHMTKLGQAPLGTDTKPRIDSVLLGKW